MLDDDDRLERNLLLCFFTPRLEEIVNDEIVYPYPFAGMSPQSIWWEDLLQTVSIRFHRSNELTRYFNIGGSGDEIMNEPVFIYGKRGARLPEEGAWESLFDWSNDNKSADGQFFIHRTRDRQSFDSWMWSRIEARVVFHNHHPHPVEMYWIYGRKAEHKVTIEPNSSSEHYSMLTHEWYARDVRVDEWKESPGRWKLSTNSSLGSWKIGVEGDTTGNDGRIEYKSCPIGDDGSVIIDIPSVQCLDLSGHCQFWAQQKQCTENPNFMRDRCMLTCGHCSNIAQQEEGECKDG